MLIVDQGHEILYPVTPFDWWKEQTDIELAARTAYHSEDKIDRNHASYHDFNAHLVEVGHLAAVEFGNMKVRFITDRGVTHALVRHRLCSFLQESTIYCNYTKDKFNNQVTFIKPGNIKTAEDYNDWEQACLCAESRYFNLINQGAKPSTARSVLPTCVKTTLCVSANFRQWRHIFECRLVPKHEHPDTQRLLYPLYLKCVDHAPEIFNLGLDIAGLEARLWPERN